MVADCLSPTPMETERSQNQPSTSDMQEEKGNPPSHRDLSSTSVNCPSQEQPEVLHHASSRLQYVPKRQTFS